MYSSVFLELDGGFFYFYNLKYCIFVEEYFASLLRLTFLTFHLHYKWNKSLDR